jgi:hypothetical protein
LSYFVPTLGAILVILGRSRPGCQCATALATLAELSVKCPYCENMWYDWFVPDKPDAIYGGVIAATTALLTVWLTNKNARARQKLDLASADRQKETERLFQLKREAYIPAIESFVAANAYISQLPTIAIEKIGDAGPMLDLARNTSRIGVVAPQDVIAKTQVAVSHLSVAQMVVTRGRLELAKIEFELRGIESNNDFLLKKQETNLAQGNSQIISGNPNQKVLDYCQESGRMLASELERLSVRRNELIRRRLEESMRLQKRAVDLLLPMAEHVAEALIAIRIELGLPIDRDWYLKFTKEYATKVFNELKTFQENIHDDIKRNIGP